MLTLVMFVFALPSCIVFYTWYNAKSQQTRALDYSLKTIKREC